MELRARGWSIRGAARETGVSRTTGNNWVRGHKTYRKGGAVGSWRHSISSRCVRSVLSDPSGGTAGAGESLDSTLNAYCDEQYSPEGRRRAAIILLTLGDRKGLHIRRRVWLGNETGERGERTTFRVPTGLGLTLAEARMAIDVQTLALIRWRLGYGQDADHLAADLVAMWREHGTDGHVSFARLADFVCLATPPSRRSGRSSSVRSGHNEEPKHTTAVSGSG